VLLIVYIVIGVAVAQSNDYLSGVDSVESILSAILAVLLWPLVLLDVNLNIGGGSMDQPSGGDAGPGGEPSGGGGDQ
jgi:hypothetical protein